VHKLLVTRAALVGARLDSAGAQRTTYLEKRQYRRYDEHLFRTENTRWRIWTLIARRGKKTLVRVRARHFFHTLCVSDAANTGTGVNIQERHRAGELQQRRQSPRLNTSRAPDLNGS